MRKKRHILNGCCVREEQEDAQSNARQRCDMRTLMVEVRAGLVTFPAQFSVRERAAQVPSDLQTRLCSTYPTEEVSTAHVQPTTCAVLRFADYWRKLAKVILATCVLFLRSAESSQFSRFEVFVTRLTNAPRVLAKVE
eukprot:scaffold84860_cov51-Attheya_sp.AAC.2